MSPEAEIVVIVVEGLVAFVAVRVILAVDVVGDRVGALFLRHDDSLPRSRHAERRSAWT